MKYLYLDIETAPLLAMTFSTTPKFISMDQMLPGHEPRIIAFSAKWHGTSKVIFHSEHHDGREEMLQALFELLDQADVVVTYNGKSFDLPWIEGEFMVEGLDRPEPYAQIDLYRELKKFSRFPSRKLDYASMRLLNERKVQHTGMRLWYDCCFNPDEKAKEKAWTLMRKYAKRDTALLEPLYESMLPWISQPVATGMGLQCSVPTCGSHDIQRRGYRTGKTGLRYQQYRCNTCGSWSRSRTKDPFPGPSLTSV